MTVDRETLIRQNVRSVAADVGREIERRRILGLLLAEVGRLRLAGKLEAAEALDRIALYVEHPNAA